MKFVKNTIAAAKQMPKSVWIGALIVPGGLTVIGLWLSAKVIYKTYKRSKNDRG